MQEQTIVGQKNIFVENEIRWRLRITERYFFYWER